MSSLTAEKLAELRKLAEGDCRYCDRGFPVTRGIHYPTQALGMIPDTACEKYSALLERMATVGAAPPIPEKWRATVLSLIGALEDWRKHQEICSGADNDTPAELDRLNPFARSYKNNPTPTEPAARFIHGLRYYAGMLEEGDQWWHSLGHIESLCKEFQAAIDARKAADEK